MRHISKIATTVRRFAILPLAAAVLAVLAVLVPASAPALASGTQGFDLIVNSGYTHAGILDQGHNQPLILSYNAYQAIDFTNRHNWVNFSGQTVTVWEIQIYGINECFNYSPTGDAVYADSCISSDTNEWFWQDPTGSSTNGAPNYWYINVGGSVYDRYYTYATAGGYFTGAGIYGDPAGFGGLAAWNRPCELNC